MTKKKVSNMKINEQQDQETRTCSAHTIWQYQLLSFGNICIIQCTHITSVHDLIQILRKNYFLFSFLFILLGIIISFYITIYPQIQYEYLEMSHKNFIDCVLVVVGYLFPLYKLTRQPPEAWKLMSQVVESERSQMSQSPHL